jgi:arylsulfatase A-like enzyme
MSHTTGRKDQAYIKTRKVIVILLSTLFFFLLFLSCTKKEDRVLFRFIDNFGQKNILLSPFQDFVLDTERFRKKYPSIHEIADQYPLLDSGIGENPFLLKKKLKIGLVEINTLLAPPRSIYRFTLKIPEHGILEFTYGIRRDGEFAQKREGNRITEFSISLNSEGKTSEIFKNTLSLNPDESLAFDYKKIDLSNYEGKKVVISFITRGSEKALACWFNPVVYSPQQNTKNVILISLDTLRPDHLGCYGYPRDTSPSIDSLSRESALFQNTFATSPWTLPSHVSMLTSLNCINHQVYHIDQTMDPSLLTLADIFRTKDYFTCAITGGGYVSGLYGFSKGFDSYHVRGAILEKNAAEIGCHYALEWIERHKDRNFFLFLHTYQIHTPYDSPAPFNSLFLKEVSTLTQIDMGHLRFNHENRYRQAAADLRQNIIDVYDGEIRYTDEFLIKPLLESLKKLGLYDNTMIILTSDHGEEFYEHGSWEHTNSVYNETIKIPLIIKFFNSEHEGKEITKYARIIDIMPTILDALDIRLPEQHLDGESLFALLSGEEQEKRERIFISELAPNVMQRHVPKKVAINRDKHKLILNKDFKPEDLAYFFSPPPEIEPMQVFDLEADPNELENKVHENPQLAQALLDLLKTHNKQKGKVIPQEAELTEELREQLKALGYIK